MTDCKTDAQRFKMFWRATLRVTQDAKKQRRKEV
jgi:hypothetical protein